MIEKPFSQACENNKRPILDVLQRHWSQPGRILEIGSGTGQHAVYFAAHLPHLQWQTSDLSQNHSGIKAWMADYPGENLLPPLVLDVNSGPWPHDPVDGVFTANTLHICAWPEVQRMFAGVSACLRSGGKFIVYGPFNFNGQFTSDSNRAFDQHLRAAAAHRAIRDFEAVRELADSQHMRFLEDNALPANNRCLVFVRR